MNKAHGKLLIGLSGEYLTAGMMSLKGWVASLTLKNYPCVDIFGMNPATGQTQNIQVKTTRNQTSYNIGLNHNNRDAIYDKIIGPFVFVHIDKNDKVRYFILKRDDLIRLIIETDDIYYNKPRANPLKDYPIGILLKDIIIYENQWNNLWS